MSQPTRRLILAITAATVVLALVAAGPIRLPLVVNGAPMPARTSYVAPPGYRLIGATPFVTCAADGTLRFSAFSITADFTGHAVFSAEGVQLVELPQYRATGSRGSITGQSLERCGVSGVLSVNLLNDQTLVVVRGD